MNLDSKSGTPDPESPAWASLPAHLGIQVHLGPTPRALSNALLPRPYVQITDGAALLRLPNGVSVLVEDGESITIEWDADLTDPDLDYSWILNGWAVMLAWLQRGQLSLHAATVRIREEVTAIAGARGAGKSTTAVGLGRRGHTLLVDDVALLDLRGGVAWTVPFARAVHLMPDAIKQFGLDRNSLQPLAGGRAKSSFRGTAPPSHALLLDRVVIISADSDVAAPSMSSVRGSAKVGMLNPHVSHNGVTQAILGQERYFELLTQLAQAVRVDELQRPRDQWTLEGLLDLITLPA